MITRRCETSGSVGMIPFKGTPIGKAIEKTREMQRVKEIQKELAEIEKIQNKPAEERTLEEKIFLANHYSKLVFEKIIPKPIVMYSV